MKTMLVALGAALGASAALTAYAAGPDDSPPRNRPWLAAAATAAPTPAQMDSMMKSMQEMHEKMMATRTPEDRARLMQEHSALMNDCMGMVGRMHDGRGRGMSMSPEMMGRRMDMMEMMMQLMLDREAIKPPPSK